MMVTMPTASIVYTETYTLVYCCHEGCNIGFAVPVSFERVRRNDHAWFYCPNGHRQHWSGQTEEEKRIARLEKALARREDELTREMARVVDERKAHAATKGKLTKTRNRAAKAMCPVDGCRRHFSNVARHVASQHPGYHA